MRRLLRSLTEQTFLTTKRQSSPRGWGVLRYIGNWQLRTPFWDRGLRLVIWDFLGVLKEHFPWFMGGGNFGKDIFRIFMWTGMILFLVTV